ncbi:MAG: metal ABC transporter permease [Bacillota bacterium]|nr:metal ABC transporter permease [Bacillota bacterium]
MPEILQYGFMVRALVAGSLLAVALAAIGTVVVYRRLSMIGDTLAHTSLAGVAIGLVAGFQPLLGALLTAVIAALAIELIRSLVPRYAELALAVVMSLGVGVAGLLSGFSGAGNFESYLFGSLIAIQPAELRLVAAVTAIVLLVSFAFYRELFFIGYDAEQAGLSGVPVRAVQIGFTLLTALAVAIAARLAGSLVVSSLMVLPVVSAMLIARSYRQNSLFAMLYGLVYMLTGLAASFYLDTKPGATVVLVGVAGLGLTALGRGLFRQLRRRRLRKETSR